MESLAIRDVIYTLAPSRVYTCTAMENCEDPNTLVVTQTKVTEKVCAQRKSKAWLDAWRLMDARQPACGHVQVGPCTAQAIDVCLY